MKIGKIVLIGNPNWPHSHHLENRFLMSSPEPLGYLSWNIYIVATEWLVDQKYIKYKILPVRNPRWPPQPPSWKPIFVLFSRTIRQWVETNTVATGWPLDRKLLRLCQSESQDGFLSVFFSETAWAIFTRFHMGLSVKRVLTIYSNGSMPLKRWGSYPNMVKRLKNLLLQNQESFEAESSYSIGDKVYFVQMMVTGWPLTFLW